MKHILVIGAVLLQYFAVSEGVGVTSVTPSEEISCLCGQYRWALSNPRDAKLSTYHCNNATNNQTCTSEGCYGTCKTNGYCFKNIKRNETHVIKTYDCIVEQSYVINRPNFNCENHNRNEKIYVNGCCRSSWCTANLTLDTTKLFERGIHCFSMHVFSQHFLLLKAKLD